MLYVIIVFLVINEIWWIMSKSELVKRQFVEEDINKISKFLSYQTVIFLMGVLVRLLIE